MDAYIALSPDEQRLYCEQAQTRLNLPATSIEKDFWVCWTLRELFGLPKWGEHLAFKGGTSLSKAWKLIERFSEDIDVVISRDFLGFGEEALSNNRQKTLIKKCSDSIHQELLPLLTEHISVTSAFAYPTTRHSGPAANHHQKINQPHSFLRALPLLK